MGKNEKLPLLRWLWKSAEKHHRHPPPKGAAPVGPQFTLGGSSHQPSPMKAASPSSSNDTPLQKLEDEVELRRTLLRRDESRSREAQRRAHAATLEQQREKLDRDGVVGIQRLAAEQPLVEQFRDEQHQLDAYFVSMWKTLETEIATALDAGMFSDPLAAAFNRAAARDAGRDANDGGRVRE